MPAGRDGFEQQGEVAPDARPVHQWQAQHHAFDIGNHLELAGLILARPQFETRERVLTFNVETNKATYLAANGDMPGMAEPAVAARIKAQTASAERLGI